MTDTAILAAAIEATGLSARRFAVEVLGVDERTVRRWTAGDRSVPPTVVRVCALIVREPAVADRLAVVGRQLTASATAS